MDLSEQQFLTQHLQAMAMLIGSEVVPEHGDAPGMVSDSEALRVVQPSIGEWETALKLGTAITFPAGDIVSPETHMLRVILIQNNLIVRDRLAQRKRQMCSLQSSDSTSPFDGSAMASAGGSGKCSPPAVFPCPFCKKSFNEKDFDRHVKNWQGKEELATIKSNVCPGPRNVDDPFLVHFTGSHSQRVAALIAGVRSLLRPGAYDSMSPTGSGRHRAVIAHFAALQRSILPE